MQPIREEDDVLARLETRLGAISELVQGLKQKNAELEAQLREAVSTRDSALEQSRTATEQAAHLREEVDSLHSRQKQAATRIKTLLNQVEQMDLLSEN
jgi:uncharacterized coiled-coil DUF342 family protein